MTGNDGVRDLQSVTLKAVEASWRVFLLGVRKDIGRPLTAREAVLAQLAHGVGFYGGVEFVAVVGAAERAKEEN